MSSHLQVRPRCTFWNRGMLTRSLHIPSSRSEPTDIKASSAEFLQSFSLHSSYFVSNDTGILYRSFDFVKRYMLESYVCDANNKSYRATRAFFKDLDAVTYTKVSTTPHLRYIVLWIRTQQSGSCSILVDNVSDASLCHGKQRNRITLTLPKLQFPQIIHVQNLRQFSCT